MPRIRLSTPVAVPSPDRGNKHPDPSPEAGVKHPAPGPEAGSRLP